MNKYTPNPIDTSGIEVPEELLQLTDLIARNVHETWANERMKQGWTYGPVRNDMLKQHPCLVPYDDLPETETIHDHITSMETIKVILKFGFEIRKKSIAS